MTLVKRLFGRKHKPGSSSTQRNPNKIEDPNPAGNFDQGSKPGVPMAEVGSSSDQQNAIVPLGKLDDDHWPLTVVGSQGSETKLPIPFVDDFVLEQSISDVNELDLDTLRARFLASVRLIQGMRQAIMDYSRMYYQHLENERLVNKQLQEQLEALQSRDKDDNASKFEELAKEEVVDNITPTLAQKDIRTSIQESGPSVTEQADVHGDDAKLVQLPGDPATGDVDLKRNDILGSQEDSLTLKVENAIFFPLVIDNRVHRLELLSGERAADEPEEAEDNDSHTAGGEAQQNIDNVSIMPSARENIETLWGWLTDEDVGTIGIQGNQGVGKTWTVRKLMDRAVAANLFDVYIWVHGELNYYESLMQIADQLNLKLDTYWVPTQVKESELRMKISKSLAKMHFLLILDDIGMYNQNDIGIPDPKEQNKSSKVLIVIGGTATNIAVDKIRKLEKLSIDEAWLLFQKITEFRPFEIGSPVVRELAQPMLEKCKGVPFEIAILAGTLRNHLASESGSSFSFRFLRSQQLLANLQKAYNLKILRSAETSHVQFICEMLPDKDTRDCFLLSCIYPKHYQFTVKELITLWMKLGLLDGFDCLEKAYDKGHNILRELIDRCLFHSNVILVREHDDMTISVQSQLLTEAIEYVSSRWFDVGFLERCALGGGTGVNSEKSLRPQKLLKDRKNLDESLSFLLYGDAGNLPHILPDVFFEKMSALEDISLLHAGIRSLPTSLSKLNHLHVLVIRGCGFLENVNQVSELKNLRILSLSGASSLQEIRDDFFLDMDGLETLDVSNSQIKQLPSSFSGLINIRFLILQGCSYLKALPSMEEFHQLFLLDLSGASALTSLPNLSNSLRMLDLSETLVDRLPSISKLNDLEYLILRRCSLMKTVPHPYAFPTLKVLDLSGAHAFREFEEEVSGTKSSLVKLDLSETQILQVPDLSRCVKLREVLLRSCPKLQILPSLGGELEVLDLSGTIFFESFKAQALGNGLLNLDFSRTQIGKQPLYTMEAANVVQLLLRECEYLEELPHLEFEKLRVLDLSGSINFKKFKDNSLGKLFFLDTLNLSATQVVKLPTLSECRHLRQILLRGCWKLETLPELETLNKLEVLDLFGATAFKQFQDISLGKKEYFEELDLSRTQVVQIPTLSECQNLCKLILRGCTKLEMLPRLEVLTSLQVLIVSGVASSSAFQDLSFGNNIGLEILDFSESQIMELPSSLSGCANLCQLLLRDCPNFKTLPRLKELTKLETLDLSGDASFSQFKDESLGNNHALKKLDLSRTKVTEFSFLAGCDNLSQLSLRGCSNLEMLSFEGMPNLQSLDLSESPITVLSQSILKLHILHQLLLKGCSSLTTLPAIEVLPKLKVLDLSCTIREFPRVISKWTHLRFLGVLNRKFFWGFDWENTSEIIEQIKWDSCESEEFGKACVHITVSNTEVFLFIEKNMELWETCFRMFHFCLCSIEEWRNEKDIYLQGKQFVFMDIYYQTCHIPQLTEEPDKFFKICGFKTFPDGIEQVLSHVDLLYLKKNDFITRLSDLGAENVKVMRECWIERCDRMEATFYGEEMEENLRLGRCLENLWVSYLSELKYLFKGVVPSGSFTCLKHMYVDCCPSLISLFSLHFELTKLEKLEIKFCDELENVCGGGTPEQESFPMLSTLILWKLPKLKSICEGVLPSLENLRVKGCSELKKLPLISSSSRVKIKGEQVWWSNLDRENQSTMSQLDFAIL